MKHWDSEFWTQHLQDCFFLQDEGFETADEAAELGWAKEDFHAWWYCSNPIVDLLPSTCRSSWTKRCGKAEKCIKMRYGASEIVRFWMQKILKLYFLSAAITTDLVGVVMVFTCSLQQLATSPDLLCLARMSCHERWHFSNPNSDILPPWTKKQKNWKITCNMVKVKHWDSECKQSSSFALFLQGEVENTPGNVEVAAAQARAVALNKVSDG